MKSGGHILLVTTAFLHKFLCFLRNKELRIGELKGVDKEVFVL